MRPKTLAVALPPEPPPGSVVLDYRGIAWQRSREGDGRRADRWYPTLPDFKCVEWSLLNTFEPGKPLTLVYTPTQPRKATT